MVPGSAMRSRDALEPFVSGYIHLAQSGMGLAIARQVATLADGR